MTIRKRFITGISIVATVILFYIFKKYRSKFDKERTLRNILQPSKVLVIEDIASCDSAIKVVESEITNYPVIGLDCEWISKQKRNPVSLLQLATSDGMCVLIRIMKFERIPLSLVKFLENGRIIKVGSAVTSDAALLLADYQIRVSGCVDIDRAAKVTNFPGGSLKRMAEEILNLSLNKSKSIQCSDWEAEKLSDEQINYAALDAFIPIKILEKIIKIKSARVDLFETDAQSYFLSLWEDIIDSSPKLRRIDNQKMNNKTGFYKPIFEKRNSIKGPLYENCFLQDPDGNILCVCNNKKLNWYIKKGLGKEISESPRIVRLNFRPKPFEKNEDSMYYTIQKDNKCVVCGGTNLLRRKNVVPYEYRSHFPNQIKDYKSHDIVLLCSICHRESVIQDQRLRKELSVTCEAPIIQMSLTEEARKINKLKFTANALLKKNTKISAERIEELKESIRSHINCEEVTDKILRDIMKMSVPKVTFFETHGEKVVKYFQKHRTLNELEFIWRSHFLNSMKPEFLPKFWSVSHNPWRD